jgi:multicomponent Na+:H+ antiporter subunit F
MTEFFLAAAGLIVATVAAGLAMILRGPTDIERLMSLQVLGTGGIAALLLIAFATQVPGVDDVALGLALLAPFAAIALANMLRAEDLVSDDRDTAS